MTNRRHLTITYVILLSLNTGILIPIPISPVFAEGPCANPTIIGDGIKSKIIGTSGNDIIQGTAIDEMILGLGGDDIICAGGGNDVVIGGDGN
ncbi:MAG: hypothetical protein QXI92_02725, partial [Candidatus Nitrosocaldus sp.]